MYELSLDNDVILWKIPQPAREWLRSEDPTASLLLADLVPALGQFTGLCGDRALNSGVRGLSPGFDLEEELPEALRGTGVRLQSELDEQGLQAAFLLKTKLFIISTDNLSSALLLRIIKDVLVSAACTWSA